jgi:hypothetical protein
MNSGIHLFEFIKESLGQRNAVRGTNPLILNVFINTRILQDTKQEMILHHKIINMRYLIVFFLISGYIFT